VRRHQRKMKMSLCMTDSDPTFWIMRAAVRLSILTPIAYVYGCGIALSVGTQSFIGLKDGILPAPNELTDRFQDGFNHCSKEDWGQAIADFSEVIRLNSVIAAAAHVNRGAAYIAKEDFDNGIADFTRAIEIDATNFTAYLDRAGAYAKKGDYPRAVADYNECIKLGPSSDIAFLGRGLAHTANGDVSEAIVDFNQCLRLNPANVMAYASRANAFDHTGQMQKAIADYTEALTLSRQDIGMLADRGWDYFILGQFSNATKDLEEAISINPNDSHALNNLAWLRATCPVDSFRDGKKAVELATKACHLTDWKKSWCLDTLAAACAESADFDNAVKYQKRAMEMTDVKKEASDTMQKRLNLYVAQKPNHDGQRP
jgi:tetratricopeptide (TPR) repeat protein